MRAIARRLEANGTKRESSLALELCEKTDVPLEQAELGSFGASHAQIGAYLFALWGFPDNVVQAVENHHKLAEITAFTPALAIHAAQCLDPSSTKENQLNTALLSNLGLDSRIEVWRSALADQPT